MKIFLLILLTAFPVFGQLNIGNPFFVAGLLGSSVAAGLITPVAATAQSFYNGAPPRPPVHAIDGSDMTPNSPVTASSTSGTVAAGRMWLSNGNQDTWITFDLGSVQTIAGFHLWNYNEHSGSPDIYRQRGVKTAGIYAGTSLLADGASYASAGTAWGTLVQNMTFTKAPGFGGYAGEDYLFTVPVTTRYLQIYVTSNFGPPGDNYTGISEIRFIASVGYRVENDSAFPLEFALYPADIRTNSSVQQWPMRYNSMVLSNDSIATTNWAVKSDSGLNGKPTANFYGSATASPYFHGNLTSTAPFQITMVVSLTNNSWMSGNTVLWDTGPLGGNRHVLYHLPTYGPSFQLTTYGGVDGGVSHGLTPTNTWMILDYIYVPNNTYVYTNGVPAGTVAGAQHGARDGLTVMARYALNTFNAGSVARMYGWTNNLPGTNTLARSNVFWAITNEFKLVYATPDTNAPPEN